MKSSMAHLTMHWTIHSLAEREVLQTKISSSRKRFLKGADHKSKVWLPERKLWKNAEKYSSFVNPSSPTLHDLKSTMFLPLCCSLLQVLVQHTFLEFTERRDSWIGKKVLQAANFTTLSSLMARCSSRKRWPCKKCYGEPGIRVHLTVHGSKIAWS